MEDGRIKKDQLEAVDKERVIVILNRIVEDGRISLTESDTLHTIKKNKHNDIFEIMPYC